MAQLGAHLGLESDPKAYDPRPPELENTTCQPAGANAANEERALKRSFLRV